jgi:phospholipid/cholesterol/gamma-HCH transport system ATP-binding protein
MAEAAQIPVEVRDLRKSFGDQQVLNGISLSVSQGETVAVLGRSGTGKSVLLKLLVGLQPADSGSVRIGGQELIGLDLRPLNEI